MAGFIPGFVLGGLLIVTAVIIAKINKYGVHPPFSWRERIQSFRHSLPALGFPVIILCGIYGGIFTPTEAGAVAIFYGLFIGFFVYRELKLPQLKESLLSTVRSTSMILIIIVGAILVGRVFGFTAVPRNVASFMSHLGVGWMAFLAMVIVLYYFMGMFFETVSIFVLTIPLIWPTMMQLGINPVHFGIIATICIEMMAITPPVGFNLYVMSGIGKEPIEEVVHGVLPFYIPMVVGTFLVAYVPIISLFLPKLFGMLG